MEPFDSAIDETITNLGSKPGDRRWEFITAIAGWAAVLLLVTGLGATVLGFKAPALWLMNASLVPFGWAFKRDMQKNGLKDAAIAWMNRSINRISPKWDI